MRTYGAKCRDGGHSSTPDTLLFDDSPGSTSGLFADTHRIELASGSRALNPPSDRELYEGSQGGCGWFGSPTGNKQRAAKARDSTNINSPPE